MTENDLIEHLTNYIKELGEATFSYTVRDWLVRASMKPPVVGAICRKCLKTIPEEGEELLEIECQCGEWVSKGKVQQAHGLEEIQFTRITLNGEQAERFIT